MLTKLEQLVLNMHKKTFGQMTSAEALECALNDDQIARDCGPFDPVAGRFAKSREDMLRYAELLEKNGE